MRALAAVVVLLAALGCSGMGGGEAPEPGPDEPHELLDLPATFDGSVTSFSEFLREEPLRCVHLEERWTWNQDGSFEVATPRFKQAGSWRMREGDLVHLTKQAMEQGAECLHARVLDSSEGRFLLCAERPLACDGRVDGAIEVLDAGAAGGAVDHVAAVIGRLADDPPLAVFHGGEADDPGHIEVRYRPGEPRLRIRQITADQIAHTLARDLDIPPPPVVPWADAPSPWVVLVSGAAEPRVP